MADYVIVGNSAGGIGAIEAIRAVDREGSVALIGDEPVPAYSRPAIAELLCGTKSFDRIVYRPDSFYQEQRVETYLGQLAERIDLAGHAVLLGDGRAIPYRKLLLATGGTPIVPPMTGGGKAGILNFTTVRDAYAIKQRLETSGRRVVVIGGGLIGFSVSDALTRAGASATVVELRDRVLSLLLDEQGSALAAQAMERHGVATRLGQSVSEVLGRHDDPEAVGGVVLSSGERIECDIVVVAVGVRPRAELASAAGIKVNRGIVVDYQMATSTPNVYACGDVAEGFDFVFGGNRVVPIWPGAYMGGRVAGLNMAGRHADRRDGTTMNSLKYFGLTIVSAGEINVEGVPGYEVVRSLEDTRRGEAGTSPSAYKKVVLKDGRLAGFVFAQDIERAGILFALLRSGAEVGSFKEALLREDFDLVQLPDDWRRAHYAAASPVARNAPAGRL